ncbi:MAG: HAD family hydrolase [Limisphaerales bacterium]
MVRLALFDIDGTLIHTDGAGMRAFDRAFEIEFGIANAAQEINFAGRTDTGILNDFFAAHEIPSTPDNYRKFYSSYVHWLDLFLTESKGDTLPGALALLREVLGLPNRPAIGLLTGNIRLGAQIKLRHHRLWNFFETGAFGCEHANRNELARIAHQRGKKMFGEALSGDQVLVIGDTVRDIECANAINARCLAVATGGGSFEELKAHAPTWTVPDLAHVSAREICN